MRQHHLRLSEQLFKYIVALSWLQPCTPKVTADKFLKIVHFVKASVTGGDTARNQK